MAINMASLTVLAAELLAAHEHRGKALVTLAQALSRGWLVTAEDLAEDVLEADARGTL